LVNVSTDRTKIYFSHYLITDIFVTSIDCGVDMASSFFALATTLRSNLNTALTAEFYRIKKYIQAEVIFPNSI